MSAEVWGVIAAFAGVGTAFLAVFVGAFFWLATAIQRGSAENRAEMRELRAELRSEIRDLRADSQRSYDALYRHKHEDDGAIYVPGDDD